MQQILFPVDFSERCLQTAPAVADVARRFGASVSMVHVVKLPHLRSELAPYMHHFKTVMEELEGGLQTWAESDFKGVTVEHHLRTGDPARSIVDFATAQNADLVMMPTHGLTRFRSLLLGSVTASVLHDAECPVWTTAHTLEAQSHQPYRSILCAVDLGESTLPVLRAAHKIAARYDAILRVVHCTPASSAEEALERYAPLAIEAGLPPKTPFDLLEHGDVVTAISSAMTRHGAGLLVIGRGKLQGTLGRLRTNAHNLIRLAPAPVLSV